VDYIHWIFINFKALDHNIWYQSIDLGVFLLQTSHLSIFSIIFFEVASENKICALIRINIKALVVKLIFLVLYTFVDIDYGR
jgi:hypothetical protein